MVLFFQNFDKNLDFGVLFFQKFSPALRAGFYFHFFLLKIPLFSLVKLQKPEKVPKIFALRAGFYFFVFKISARGFIVSKSQSFFRLMVALAPWVGAYRVLWKSVNKKMSIRFWSLQTHRKPHLTIFP